MNFPLFIARRIYGKGAGSQKVAKPAIRIATAEGPNEEVKPEYEEQ